MLPQEHRKHSATCTSNLIRNWGLGGGNQIGSSCCTAHVRRSLPTFIPYFSIGFSSFMGLYDHERFLNLLARIWLWAGPTHPAPTTRAPTVLSSSSRPGWLFVCCTADIRYWGLSCHSTHPLGLFLHCLNWASAFIFLTFWPQVIFLQRNLFNTNLTLGFGQ